MTSLQIWLYAVVGGSVLLYIAIAFRARASSTGEFYVAGRRVNPSPTAWPSRRTGYRPLPLSPWQGFWPSKDTTPPFI